MLKKQFYALGFSEPAKANFLLNSLQIKTRLGTKNGIIEKKFKLSPFVQFPSPYTYSPPDSIQYPSPHIYVYPLSTF